MPGSITIALDIMSGDNGPSPAIAGAIKSLQNINDLRTAAYACSIEKIAESYEWMGIFP